MDSKNDYVKGEEGLSGWTPRGVSLVQDYIQARKQKRKVIEVETAKSVLGMRALAMPVAVNGASAVEDGDAETAELTALQQRLLEKVLTLWTTKQGIEDALLASSNTSPPRKGAAFANHGPSPSSTPSKTPTTSPKRTRRSPAKPTLTASVRFIPKNPALMKAGYLLTPDSTESRWLRRYVELRRPFLHVYSVPEGDELNAINLVHARIDHAPEVAMLLQRNTGGGGAGSGGADTVWAVFGTQNSWVFKARSERDKVEW